MDEKRFVSFLKGAVVFLVLFRFILGFYYPVFSDATKYLYFSSHPGLLLRPDFQYFPPMEFISGAFIYMILGGIGLKMVAPIFGGLGIYYTYLLGKDIFGETKGLIAAIFLGIIPSHIFLSAMAYQDIVVTSMATIFLYYLFKSSGLVDKNTLKAGVAMGFTALSKFTGPIVFPFIFVYYSFYSLKKKIFDRDLLKKCIIIALLGMLVASPYYVRELLLFGNVLGSFQVIPPKVTERYEITGSFEGIYFNKGILTQAGYQESPGITGYLREIYFDLWGIPTMDIEAVPGYAIYGYLVFSLFISLLFFYGLYMGFKELKMSSGVMVLVSWLLAWVLILLILQEQLIWGFRRLLPLAPVFALISASGFDLTGEKRKKIFCVILIMALVAFPVSQAGKAWFARDYFNQYDDSLEYIKSLPDNAVVLFFDDEQALFYSEKRTYNIARLNPEYFNMSTLKVHGITHVTRFDNYLFYDLRDHNMIIDRMAGQGELEQVWEGKNVKIYEVNYG